MEKQQCASACPWSITGATLPITGCRFTLAPMSDNYIDIILGAVKKVDTSKIFSETDKTSTIYRGKREHVINAVEACFTHAHNPKVHMTCEMTFSKGCPGDSDADSYMAENDVLLNDTSDINFDVISKISLYPLGSTEYMNGIIDAVNMAKDRNLYVKSAHYCTILKGNIHDIFKYYHDMLAHIDTMYSHYVLQATISVNSPTKD